MYLHKPDEFSEQKSVGDLLDGLERDSLVALVTRLVERDPDLYDQIEMALPMANVGESTSSPEKGKRQTQILEQTYRKQVRRILKQSRYEDHYDDWHEPAYIGDLEEILETAKKFMQAGDAEDALIMLRVLLEETLEDYDGEMDYNGDAGGFIQDLGMPSRKANCRSFMPRLSMAGMNFPIQSLSGKNMTKKTGCSLVNYNGHA